MNTIEHIITSRARSAKQLERMMGEDRRKTRVLVVDDQPRVTRFMEIYLRLKGFEVISARSGREGLDLAGTWEPDVILLDVVMPGMDGFEVMRRLRAFSKVPVIIISASPGDSREVEAAGADDFLPKPFQTDEVLQKINRLLGHDS
jgi:DNA-binding response OmpR family regulator